MPRIQPVQKDQADAKTAVLLESVGKKLGMVPNLISTMAHSLAVANAYWGFSQSLAGGLLPARLREQIALVVGETNGCGYCVAAHTALGKGAGRPSMPTLRCRCERRSRCHRDSGRESRSNRPAARQSPHSRTRLM